MFGIFKESKRILQNYKIQCDHQQAIVTYLSRIDLFGIWNLSFWNLKN